MATGKTILSEPGEWDLSEVEPRGLASGVLRWSGQSLWNFGYKHLGAMFSLGSGVGLHLDGVSAKGYDRLFFASEDYEKVGYSGGRLASARLDQYGAKPIMETGWIEDITIRNGQFENQIFLMITGPWWKTFEEFPDGPYPGIKSALFENISWDGCGGIVIHVYKHGDITFRNCTGIRNQNTADYLVPFYERFGHRPPPESINMTTTGQPVKEVLSTIGLGRARNFSAENGNLLIEGCTVGLCVNDRTPKPGKWQFDLDVHAINTVSAKRLTVRNSRFENIIDFSYLNHEWATAATNGGSMGTEAIYTKGDVDIENVTVVNCGPGEGPFIASKPGGGRIVNCELIRDPNLLEEQYRAKLAGFPLLAHKSTPGQRIKLRPGEIPEPHMAFLGLNANELLDGTPSTINGLIVRGLEEPPGGWDDLASIWGPHVTRATGMKAYDLAGNLLWSN